MTPAKLSKPAFNSRGNDIRRPFGKVGYRRTVVEDSNCIDWDAEELLRLRGEVRLQKIPGFVPTPSDLADELIDWLCLEDGDRVLDPAAGDGAILGQVRL